MYAISSGLSHWEQEGKNWQRSDERKASNLGKKKVHIVGHHFLFLVQRMCRSYSNGAVTVRSQSRKVAAAYRRMYCNANLM